MEEIELKDFKRKDFKSLDVLFELKEVKTKIVVVCCSINFVNCNCGNYKFNYGVNQLCQIRDDIEFDTTTKLNPYYVSAESVCKIENDYKMKIDSIINENQKQLNDYIDKLAILEKNEINYKNKISDLENELSNYKNIEEKLSNDLLIKDKKIEELKNMDKIESQLLEDCYDIVIEAKSLSGLEESKGWDISYGKGGKEKYQKYREITQSVIGVIGNFNKGKSFILQKLSGQKIAQGYSIATKGLSIKYPEIINKPVSIIDSEGFETPIKFLDKDNNLDDSNQTLTDLLKDRTHTEIFLQKYIIAHSSILLVVVGSLTYSDQKLINRLKSLAMTKKLIIIHNLSTFIYVDEVKHYIENTLKKTFKISEEIIDCDEDKNLINESNNNTRYFWQEKINENGDSSKESITHFIIAKEGSLAGNYYNKSTFDFLIYKIKSHDQRKIFDPIESMKLNIIKSAQDIFESDTCNILKDQNSIEIRENNGKEKLFIQNCKRVSLTKCYVDALGTSKFESSNSNFIPEFCMSKLKNNKLEISLDVPDLNEQSLKIFDVDNKHSEYRIVIKGEKANNDSFLDIKLKDNRKKGIFTLTLHITKEEISFAKFEPTGMEYENGVLKITYDLVSSEREDGDEDEGGNKFTKLHISKKIKK